MLPPGQRIAIIPRRYNADPATEDLQSSDDDRGEYLDFSTAIDRFPSIPIVNNMAISFMASNAAGLPFQFQSAEWGQTRALRAAETGYKQTSAGINLNNQLSSIGQQARSQGAVNAIGAVQGHAIVGMLGGPAAGGLAAGPTGALAGSANGLAGLADAAIASQGIIGAADIANQAALNSANAQSRTGEFVRDTNRDLAQFAARGDYANTIAGINARIQDAQMTQPSTSGQFGGDAMNLAHARVEIALRFKLIDN